MACFGEKILQIFHWMLYVALGGWGVAIGLLVFGLFSRDNLLINASAAAGTIAMTFFIAYQAFVTRKAVERMEKLPP